MKRSKSTLWGGHYYALPSSYSHCRSRYTAVADRRTGGAGSVRPGCQHGCRNACLRPCGFDSNRLRFQLDGRRPQAYWSDNNSTLGGEVVVAPDGTFTDPGLKIPTGVASGPHQILFSDVEGRYFEVASFDVTGTSPTPPPSSCSAPSVSLTPSAGPVGSQFVMKGAGWISGGVVHITLPNGSMGIFGAADATPTVSAGGAWQTTVTVGKSPAGSYTFTFAETGCTSQTGTFQVTASPAPPPACPSNPTVAFSPSSGHLGTTFTITGSGWVPGGKVTGTLPYGSPGLFYGYQTPTVNASGGFSYKETVGTGPGGPTPPGSYTFTYAEKYGGCSSSFRQTFTVTPKPPAGHVPAAPSNLTVTAVDQNDIRLNWQDNSNDETRFEINNGVISKYVGANSRSYKWGGLAPGTHMCFMIRAHNSAGDSAWDPNVSPSNVCTTTPKPTASATGNLPYLDQYQVDSPSRASADCDCGVADAAMVIVAYGKHAAVTNGYAGPFLANVRADSGNAGVCSNATKDYSADLVFSQIEAALNPGPGTPDYKAWSLTYAGISKSLSPDDALAQIKAAVDAGKPVIALLHGADLTTNPQGTPGPYQGRGESYGDHFVVVKAVSGTTVTFNDPDNQQPKFKVYPYWLLGGPNTTLGVGQFEKALKDVVGQGNQPYAISVGDGTVGG
jgi:hypothetical protein